MKRSFPPPCGLVSRPAAGALCAAASLLVAACSPNDRPAATSNASPSGPAASATTSAGPPVATARATGPCALLTDAEVRAVFPGAKAGSPERSREQYGIHACVWDTPSGSFALQQWAAKGGTVDNEIRGLAAGFVSPVNPNAAKAVRYETVPNLGEQAMVLVEKQDDTRGILTDAAVLVTLRGGQFLELQSQELARGDRAAAVQSLGTLGRSAVARL